MDRLKESTWFEVFRVGTWNGMEYTKEDLDKMVENFEKGDPKAPLIIGHNDFWGGEEKPAHGWVQALKRSGKKLMAKARNVSAELVEAVNDEIYPMRSIELWRDYNGRGMALGAIAFLGGSNPAVGGMADFQFSKGAGNTPIYAREKEGRVCLSYTANTKFEEADEDLPEQHHHKGGGDSTMTKEEIQKAIQDGIAAGIDQFKAGEEFQGLVQANKELTTQLAESQNKAAAAAVEADIKDCQTFAKGLLDAKKVTPAQFNAGLPAFIASLDNTDEVEFSDGKKQTRRAFAKELLEALPVKGSLFTKVDDEEPRAGEDDNIPADVEKFAKANSLDPKIVAQQFKAQRAAFQSSALADDDEATVPGVRVSLAKTAAK